MTITTDLDYYMNDDLISLLDLTIKRQKRKWDNLLVVDGEERGGKTTMVKTMAYYIAWKKKQHISLENFFFDPQELLKFAISTEEQIIVWDEAAFGGLSTSWQSKMQQKLCTMLMVTGKYRHTYIFIIPSFFRLNRYMALDRSSGLIHIYSPDMLSRGSFTCYNRSQKTWIYNSYRKSETYGKVNSFRGQFTLKNTQNIIDEVEYEKKKDEAIHKFLNKVEVKDNQKLLQLQYNIATKLPTNIGMEVANVCRNTIYDWKKHNMAPVEVLPDIKDIAISN